MAKGIDNMRHSLLLASACTLLASATSCRDDLLADPSQSDDVMRFAVADRLTRSSGSETDASTDMKVLTASGCQDSLYMYSMVREIEGNITTAKTRGAIDGDLGDFLLSCAREEGGSLLNYYFKEQTYDSKGVNTDGNEFYWLNTGTQNFRFYGVAPAVAASKLYSIQYPAPSGLPVIKYTVPTDPADQLDLKAVTTEAYPDNYKQIVPLGFKHLCTAITFEADESVFPGKILGIKFEGVHDSGVYDMTAQQWTGVTGSATFAIAPDKEVSFDVTEITPQGEASFFMMPQTLPEGAKITVSYENSVSHKEYQLTADLSGMEWPAGKVVNYLISTAGITGQQIGLHIHATADKKVLPAAVSLTSLGSSQELLNRQPVVSSTSFDLNAPDFIDNMIAQGLTGKQYYKLTLTNTTDPANTQELMVEYHFDYMAFTVDITDASQEVVMPFDPVPLAGQTPGKHPSTLMFRWQPDDYSAEFTAVTSTNRSKKYNTPGKRQLRVYSSISGETAVPAYLTGTKVNFPLQTVSVDTKLLKGPNDGLNRLFLKCKNLVSVPGDLFIDNGHIHGLVQTFQECEALSNLPAELFHPLVNVENFEATFRQCLGLKKVPVGFFDKCVAAQSYTSTFQHCRNLETIPSGLFDNSPQAAWFNNTFQACYKLREIPAGLFAKNPKARSFSYTFHTCTTISSIPADLFRGCSQADDFSNTFQGCSALASIGNGLLDDCVKGKIYHSTFMGTAVSTVPSKLFSKSVAATDFSEVFSTCPKLISIPGDIFEGCDVATNFTQAFNNCPMLNRIPAELFRTNVKAQNFSSTFNRCTSLKSIPSGLFSNNREATSFNSTFQYCSGITSPLPSGLFAGLSKATDFTLTFRGCEKMTGAIPADLFRGCSKAKLFTSTFYGCSALEGPVPQGFFQDCDKTATTEFFATFGYCTNLKGPIPTDLFKGFTKVKRMDSFFFANRYLSGNIPENLFADQPELTSLFAFFGYCNSLTGDIPDRLFANNRKLQNVGTMFFNCNLLRKIPLGLFDNCPDINDLSQTFADCFWITGEVPALWLKYPNAEHNACFYQVGMDHVSGGGSYVTNYNAIPADWKDAPKTTINID